MSDLPRKVILGMHELYKDEPSQIQAIAQEIFVHERYDRSDQDNDLMLIKVCNQRPLHNTIMHCVNVVPV